MNGNELSAETLEQLEVLEQSKFFTWVLVAGILLSIGNIELQEQELVTGVQNHQIIPSRIFIILRKRGLMKVFRQR